MSAPMHSVDAHKKAQFDARVRELYRMPKARLVQMINARHNFVLGAPTTAWSKDELVSDVLRDEFPGIWS